MVNNAKTKTIESLRDALKGYPTAYSKKEHMVDVLTSNPKYVGLMSKISANFLLDGFKSCNYFAIPPDAFRLTWIGLIFPKQSRLHLLFQNEMLYHMGSIRKIFSRYKNRYENICVEVKKQKIRMSLSHLREVFAIYVIGMFLSTCSMAYSLL